MGPLIWIDDPPEALSQTRSTFTVDRYRDSVAQAAKVVSKVRGMVPRMGANRPAVQPVFDVAEAVMSVQVVACDAGNRSSADGPDSDPPGSAGDPQGEWLAAPDGWRGVPQDA